MTAQAGRLILIKVEDSPGALTYTTIGGIRTKTIKINDAVVDITDSNSAGRWRELAVGFGVRSLDVAGGGLYKNDAPLRRVIASIGVVLLNYQMCVPAFGIWTGPFALGDFTWQGGHEDEVKYDSNYASAGELAFQSAAS